ncbi:MAG: hypothetical protein WD469_02360 [Paenibacillaceae bacterium]
MDIRKFPFIIVCTLIIGMIASVSPHPYMNNTPTVEAKTNTYNMSYVYYGKTPELIQSVDATHGALQTCQSLWLHLRL